MSLPKTKTERKQENMIRNGSPKSKNGKANSKIVKSRSLANLTLEKNGHGHPNEILDKELLKVLTEVKNGNFKVRMPIDNMGLSGKICDTLNDIISLNEKLITEFTRAGSTIGKQGKLTQRIEIPNAKGDWATGVDSLNTLISDLVHH